jgi:hypothetical protein
MAVFTYILSEPDPNHIPIDLAETLATAFDYN